jgi:chromate reductase
MDKQIKILGIAGSLRKGSYNRAPLRAARQLAPANSSIEIIELDGVPPFNRELENPPPEIVANLKEKIRSAVTLSCLSLQNYSYSVPGVLKNAIHWASRPYGDNVWDGKPAAIIGASIGMTSSARAQYRLWQMFVILNVFLLNRSEVMMILNAADKFDKEGNLVDETTRVKIRELVETLVRWTIRHKKMRQKNAAAGCRGSIAFSSSSSLVRRRPHLIYAGAALTLAVYR